jgi:hypothetical protein
MSLQPVDTVSAVVLIVTIVANLGPQLWVERERVATLQKLLQQSSGHVFISFEEQTINTADIVGIFTAQTMGELTNRKNGKWQCPFSEWHRRGDDCNCADQKLNALYEERRNLIKACEVCHGVGHTGVIEVGGKQMYDRCACNVEITKQIAEWEQKYELYHGFYKDGFG